MSLGRARNLREQLSLLVCLYRNPIHAASRIIDEGRIWFAVATAMVVMVGLQVGVVRIASKFVGKPATVAAPVPHSPTAGPANTSDLDPAPLPHVAPPDGAWRMFMNPAVSFKLLAILGLAFAPAVILVITCYRSHESFPVVLRKDYLPLLNCVLLAFAAALLPVAVIGLFWPSGPSSAWQLIAVGGLCAAYFYCLACCCIRTLWGLSYPVALLTTAVGCGGLVLGTVVATVTGGSFFYLSSPFYLYYAWAFIGSDVRALGDGFRSRQHVRRQLDIAAHNPRDGDAQYQLGLIYLERRQWEEAKVRFLRAVEIDPREADPMFQLGRIALEQGQFAQSQEWLRKAAALDDKCASNEVWRELGKACWHTSQWQDALTALDKYVSRRPYDPEGQYWRGKVLLALGSPREASEAFVACQEAVVTMPPHRRRQLQKWRRMAAEEARKIAKLPAMS